MSDLIQSIDKAKLYVSIVEQIGEAIRSGAFPAGHVLPAERVLATQFGVSRSSLREAIRVLEHAGVLEVRTGSGTYVRTDAASKATMLRAHAAAVGEHSPLDVVAARRAVEPTCAGLAALHRRQRDVDLLRAKIEEQAELNARGDDAEPVDLSFHIAVAAASQNPVLLMLVERLVDVMQQGIWRQLKHQTRSRVGRADAILDHHKEILAAIEEYDSPAAVRAMRAHLDTIEQNLLAEIPEGDPPDKEEQM
jgi:GntR family transcriptional regulator, transcriptional repressor for pyruvate dehydrogenase complex